MSLSLGSSSFDFTDGNFSFTQQRSICGSHHYFGAIFNTVGVSIAGAMAEESIFYVESEFVANYPMNQGALHPFYDCKFLVHHWDICSGFVISSAIASLGKCQ